MNGSPARAHRTAAWLACALAFGLPLAASAQEQGQACRAQRLSGLYVFSASGYNIVGGAALPKAIVEMIEFNGDATATTDGTVTVPAVTLSINGNIIQRAPGGSGRYTLGADCRGTLTFEDGTGFDIASDLGGATLWLIQTHQNVNIPGSPVFQGTASRLRR